MGEVSRITDEALRGLRIIKVFGGAERESRRFAAANESNKRLHLKLIMARAGGDGLTMLLAAVGVASVAWFVAQYSVTEGLEVEKFTGFMAAMLLLMTPLKHLTNVNASLQRGTGGCGIGIWPVGQRGGGGHGRPARCARREACQGRAGIRPRVVFL